MKQTFSKLTMLALLAALVPCLAGCMALESTTSESEANDADAKTKVVEESSSAADEAEEAEEAQPEEAVTTCKLFRLTLTPDEASAVTVKKTEKNCLVGYYDDTPLFELASYDTFDKPENEAKHRDYSCGYGADKNGWHEVTLAFYYMAPDDSGLAHWGDTDAKTLAVSYLAGLSEADIYDGVEIQVASGDNVGNKRWDATYPVLVIDDPEYEAQKEEKGREKVRQEEERRAQEAAERKAAEEAEKKAREAAEAKNKKSKKSNSNSDNAAASSSYESPFWGVWVAAYKDAGNAEAAVAEAQASGWPDAAYYVSNRWENLNPDTWYVVSLKRCGSQSEAETAVSKAHKSGYGDAYVRHTGDYIG